MNRLERFQGCVAADAPRRLVRAHPAHRDGAPAMTMPDPPLHVKKRILKLEGWRQWIPESALWSPPKHWNRVAGVYDIGQAWEERARRIQSGRPI